ncbi:MAG: LD-carboxypeptidase [Acidobacteriota bacterium]|nr:LD-carboxypeptidase [Acidobacteriota bacterium]MXW69858.1 LD-carboxypeptidase [Acidobacteriota bacterium]MYE43710.1 LD-carboxypeptidase [Acidobacteriota bacterium]
MPIRPGAVLPGATVGILAPASPVQLPWLEAGEAELRRVGLVPRRSRNLLKRSGYTAGSAAERTEDFLELLEDEEVSALFGARGGYGCLDLLPRIPADRLRHSPKAILGGSDLTALLSLLSGAGVVSFHGPMVAQQIARGPSRWEAEETLGLLRAREPGFGLSWWNAEALHPGRAEGVLRGGCLSILAALAGTPFATSFRGAIAVLEDISVKPYQIERMLTQLALAGLLDGVRGIVFGRMPGCTQHPDQGYTTAELLARLSERFEVPVVFGFATGHTDEHPCRTIPFEVRARMDEDGLTLLEGAVE